MVALERRTVETRIPGYARRNRQTVMYDFSDVSSSYDEGADCRIESFLKAAFSKYRTDFKRRWDETSPLSGQRMGQRRQ